MASYDLTDLDLGDALARSDIIVDALLGYGARGAPHGEVEHLVGRVAGSGRPVVSLDVPTGVDPDTGVVAGSAVIARATLALALPKPGLSIGEGAARAGRLHVADIGLPAALYARLGIEIGTIFAAGRIVTLDPSR